MIYKTAQDWGRVRQTDDHGMDKLIVKSRDTYPEETCFVPPINHGLSSIDAPFLDPTQSASNLSCPPEEQQLANTSSNAWEHFPVNHEVSITKEGMRKLC